MKELAAQKSAEKEAANVKSASSNPPKKVAQSSSTDHQVNGNGDTLFALLLSLNQFLK